MYKLLVLWHIQNVVANDIKGKKESVGNRLISFFYKLISVYYSFGEYSKVCAHEAVDEPTMIATILATFSTGHDPTGQAYCHIDTGHKAREKTYFSHKKSGGFSV